MKCCFVRKVPFRLPGTSRLVWSVTLAEREGLTLLFVRRPDDNRSHAIVIATENVAERVYEAANASVFPVVHEDLMEIGNTVQALGEGLSKEELRKFFQMEN